ncbi:MAG: UDP-N-acetylmuramoyl-L-alanyl-D-glutamate--2,6-diaminopimelate ligase [Bdellovibrionales bacterium]|nr:UDP-N-acetylmuramoyl-L-alanyl-D-glutamate--2,6-diaminopimelate ligase [Bdellovibrionales bacterium]
MILTELLEILLEEFPELPRLHGGEVSAVTASSDDVRPGSVFVAIPGTKIDGHSFLAKAKAAGARLMIGERPGSEFGLSDEEYLRVPDSRLALGLLASQFERNPSREMMVIGVTGTSGKTTTSFLVEAILRAAGMKVGLLGTVSFRIDGRELPSTHTTPGPVELHQLLREMRKAGCSAVVMEISSHALKQHRAAGLAVDAAVFTNLTPEHLDYHPDLEDYYSAKRMLFREQSVRSRRWGKVPALLVHAGNPEGVRLLKETPPATPFEVPADAVLDADGVRGTFSGIAIDSPLLGRFNAENIAAAVAATKALGIPEAAIQVGIRGLARVPGRLDRVLDPKGGRVVLVDYAHKPDALEKVLEVLRPMRKSGGKLITVVGCGGDRDRTKRPVMGEIACRLSDQVIFTSDNPRTEDPSTILREIEAGCAAATNRESEIDRKKAIYRAIKLAKSGDIVLIAGKGHEDYQILGTEKIHFDDREVAAAALVDRKGK